MLQAQQIVRKYGSLSVLKGIDLQINRGEIVTIVGASGAGKSTLLQILGTLDSPDSGQVLLNDINVFALKDKELAAFRNQHIGFIFQFHHLMPEFTALENVCMPAFIRTQQRKKGKGENAEQQIIERGKELLEMLGLKNRGHHLPSELSGGEQQRVAVARALINNPSIIFADEPSGNLDSKNAEELHQIFLKLRSSLSQTFVIVTHNEHLANLADRKLEMQDGLLIDTTAH